MNRIIAEKDNPQCDLFWSGDPMRTIVLKNKGILATYQSNNASDIKGVFKDKDGFWTGFSARARVLVYNKSMVDDYEIPQSILDLSNSEYKAKVAIANPLFGTTTFHIAAIYSLLGDSAATEYLTDLKTNNIVIATSNGDVMNRVARGEVFCGLTDTDDANEALKEGENIGIVFLDQQGMGSLIVPNTVSIIKNSKNQENAKKIMDYLLSKETESRLAISCAQMPLHSGVDVPEGVPSLDGIIPMNINYEETSSILKEIQNYLKEWVEN
jgi:iron(III) transport system substrate-binding protein